MGRSVERYAAGWLTGSVFGLLYMYMNITVIYGAASPRDGSTATIGDVDVSYPGGVTFTNSL